MLNWIIDFSLRNRVVVLIAVLAIIAAGAFSSQYLGGNAFPDTTPVMVQIDTTAPSLNPEEVEVQIFFPIEQAIAGLTGLEKLRSISNFGLSQVVVIFEDGTDIYFARQLINERIGTVELSEGIERPKMAPVSPGLGEVFHYVLTKPGVDFSKLPEEIRIREARAWAPKFSTRWRRWSSAQRLCRCWFYEFSLWCSLGRPGGESRAGPFTRNWSVRKQNEQNRTTNV